MIPRALQRELVAQNFLKIPLRTYETIKQINTENNNDSFFHEKEKQEIVIPSVHIDVKVSIARNIYF